VTTNEKGLPGVTDAGALIAKLAAAAGFTVMAPLVPVTEPPFVSVAGTVWLPTFLRSR
jgi:hypothetical protein